MTTSDENAQIVRTFLETLSTGELERVRPLFHPDAIWKVMPKGIPGEGEHVGRDYIVDEFLAPVRGMFNPGEPKVEIDTLIAQGDLVAAELRGFGHFKNGKEYNNTYCWFFEVRDGMVYSIHEYMDSLYIKNLVEG